MKGHEEIFLNLSEVIRTPHTQFHPMDHFLRVVDRHKVCKNL
jgi:hypothetical protein